MKAPNLCKIYSTVKLTVPRPSRYVKFTVPPTVKFTVVKIIKIKILDAPPLRYVLINLTPLRFVKFIYNLTHSPLQAPGRLNLNILIYNI